VPISRKISIQNWLPESYGSQYQEKSRFKIGYPKVRVANIKKNLDSKLATLKLGEQISRKSRFKIGYPKVRGANIKKNLDSKLATLKLGEHLSRKISIQNWPP
jgi:hypothetical protein